MARASYAFHVFQHGNASLHEAIFRWSMIRMALEQRGKRGQRLVRTDLFKQLWTLHLDVFKNQLQPGLLGGRSRPDMVAQSPTSMQWHAFECKGRASAPGDADKLKAKKQAQRLVNIGGTACTLHIGAITYYRQDVLEFYWRDPPADSGEPFELRDPSVGWEAYYAPFVEAYRYGSTVAPLASDAGVSARLEELDIGLGMHPEVGPLLLEGRWGEAREAALRLSLEALGVFQPDGLRIVAGSSWYDRLAPRASGRPPTRV